MLAQQQGQLPVLSILEFKGRQKPSQTKLRKDGKKKRTSNHKQKGMKSEVYAFEAEDARNVLKYFEDHGQWLYYLLFTVGCNMARRVGDTLKLQWKHFYNPKNGQFRTELLEIQEEKTDKIANPYINDAVKNAILLYVEKTGCNPAENSYNEPVFKQLSGNYKGRVVSAYGYTKALKKAAEAVGIEYNVGTHSARKTFGKTSRMLHPDDYDSLETIGSILNHSSEKVTKRYIGMTKEKKQKYYQDMGDFFTDYVVGDKKYQGKTEGIIYHLDVNDLRELLKTAYELGVDNSDGDLSDHLAVLNMLMDEVDKVKK